MQRKMIFPQKDLQILGNSQRHATFDDIGAGYLNPNKMIQTCFIVYIYILYIHLDVYIYIYVYTHISNSQ